MTEEEEFDVADMFAGIEEMAIEDLVNNPPHYNQAGIECIDAIMAATNHNKEGYLHTYFSMLPCRYPSLLWLVAARIASMHSIPAWL